MSDQSTAVADALHRANENLHFFRTDADYAIEFGRYLANAAERFMAEQNRAAEAGELPCVDHWRALESAIHEFRKRALRAEHGVSA